MTREVLPRVAGVGALPVGSWRELGWLDMAVEACARALADARLAPAAVDGLFAPADVGYLREREKFVTQRLCEALGLAPRSMAEVEQGGMSSLLALKHAANEVRAGRMRVGLVVAVESDIAPEDVDLARHWHLIAAANAMYGPYHAAYGFLAVVPMYAMGVQRYMHECGVTAEEVAAVAAELRNRAVENPIAMQQAAVSAEEVLRSPLVAPPIRRLEACPWACGAAAAVVAHPDAAREGGRDAVALLGFGEAHEPSSFLPHEGALDRAPSAGRAMEAALAEAGLARGDLDVGLVYGAFAGTELILYEALGFFERGEAARAVLERRAGAGGATALNPDGGLLGRGHPPYVTPLLEVREAVLQLRGEAVRQVKGAKTAFVHAEHGVLNGNGVAILARRD